MTQTAPETRTLAAQALRRTLETKRVPASMSDVAATGMFEGYASLFGVVDGGRDAVMPGAFRDTLEQRGVAGVRMLWQHDPAQPIGQWLSLVEDQRGLRVRGQLNLDVAKAREVCSLMRQGAVDGLSIGFRTLLSTKDAATGVRRLTKLDLWEISVVTFPMLTEARVSAIKSGSTRTVTSEAYARLARQIRAAAAMLR